MAVGISRAKQILCWQHFPIGGLSFEQGPVLLTSWAVAHCWLHTEATTPRSCLGGPAQPLSILTLVLWHISFLTVNCALRGCAPLCQASSCNFTGVVQLPVCLVTGEKKLLSSFVTCQTVSQKWQKLLLWAGQEFPLEKRFQHSSVPVRKLRQCQILLILVHDEERSWCSY